MPFNVKIEFLKGVGPNKGELLKKELNIFTVYDLITYFPFRYEDRSKVFQISEINPEMPFIQIEGAFKSFTAIGVGQKKRLVGAFSDSTGTIEIVWFKGVGFIQKTVLTGKKYRLFGKPGRYGNNLTIIHPEVELCPEQPSTALGLQPFYHTSDKMKNGFLGSKQIGKLIQAALNEFGERIPENLPSDLLAQHGLISKNIALKNIHFPNNSEELIEAKKRLTYEEIFFVQLKSLLTRVRAKQSAKGFVFGGTSLLNKFYTHHLPFELTNAQKRVIKEIFSDLKSGKQMNRLLQGDVGSGKTIVAFLSMLIAIDSNAQCCIMAPTEILAEQHYNGLKIFSDSIDLRIALLTGSTKSPERKRVLEGLNSGQINILVGTHALLEEKVIFERLGFCVIDEQHKFGVAQRARLWTKNKDVSPHILVMTATPIPRTLAMTVYGDLDVSIIDELPKGRIPIKTHHLKETDRLKLFGFLRKEIKTSRQVYVVYPLIEESEKLDLKNLTEGSEAIARAFPEYIVGMVHGKMKQEAKEFEMARFVSGKTNILVSTTVIEVGVNVPNASVMVIENAEKFGLAQLHQLRGRVGRGEYQSYCILLTDYKMTKEAKSRIAAMVKTNDGFEIAEIDLKLRGPGDLLGTQQSGLPDLKLINLSSDYQVIAQSRKDVERLLEKDPTLSLNEYSNTRNFILNLTRNESQWGRIS